MWDWKRYKQQVDLEKTRLVHGGVLDEVGGCESGGTGVIDGCGCLPLLGWLPAVIAEKVG